MPKIDSLIKEFVTNFVSRTLRSQYLLLDKAESYTNNDWSTLLMNSVLIVRTNT